MEKVEEGKNDNIQQGIQRRSDLTIGRDRNKKAAAQLGISCHTLTDCRTRSKHRPKKTVMPSEEELRARNREPEHENAEL